MQARPTTLAEVAARADSLERFGRELADWLHTLRGLGSRPAPAATVAEAPALLAGRFTDGAPCSPAAPVSAEQRRAKNAERQRRFQRRRRELVHSLLASRRPSVQSANR